MLYRPTYSLPYRPRPFVLSKTTVAEATIDSASVGGGASTGATIQVPVAIAATSVAGGASTAATLLVDSVINAASVAGGASTAATLLVEVEIDAASVAGGASTGATIAVAATIDAASVGGGASTTSTLSQARTIDAASAGGGASTGATLTVVATIDSASIGGGASTGSTIAVAATIDAASVGGGASTASTLTVQATATVSGVGSGAGASTVGTLAVEVQIDASSIAGGASSVITLSISKVRWLVKWVHASIQRHLKTVADDNDIPIYFEGEDRETTQKEYVEVRILGPDTHHVSNKCERIDVQINILITTARSLDNVWRNQEIADIFMIEMDDIPIFRLGATVDDDQTHFACLPIRRDISESMGLKYRHLGRLGTAIDLIQGMINATYRIKFL